MTLDWSPEYPNAATLAYLRAFIAGCEMESLTGIPERLQSRLIDIALGQKWQALPAGRTFARLYWRLSKRRQFRDGLILNESAYLLGAYEKELSGYGSMLYFS